MDPHEHKLGAIREILDVHPTLPFVLVGDSGQEDAEIYARIAREHPGRIHAIYIREVGRAKHAGAVREIAVKMRALNVPMLLAPDTVAAAEHAAARGLISAAALPEIRQEKREDARGGLL
jgi:phosphatidate phosphatase APP1